jgi:phosphatidylserine decarboxylase
LNRYADDVPPVARDGWPYVGLLLAMGAAAWAALPAVAWLLWAAAAFCLWFFRDPRRDSPADDRLVLSPADGVVLSLVPFRDDPDAGTGTVVCIFMNVFNVHVNRSPLDGTVTAVRHRPGRFLSAFKPQAPTENERVETVVSGGRGTLKFVQIAGLIARRIVNRLRVGDAVVMGERIGLIKFGSRVDVYIPSAFRVRVAEGEKVTAALSVLAECHG